MGTRHQMECSPVRRSSRFASVTKLWRSCFYPTREVSSTLVEDVALNTSDAAEHSDSDSAEEMDEYDEYDAAEHSDSDSAEEMDEYDEYDAAERAWTGERTEYFSPRIAAMIWKRRQGLDGVEHEMKFSKTHHSTVVPPATEEAELDQENRKVFQNLRKDPQWWISTAGIHFFQDWDYELGGKIAEGGQAEIFAVDGVDDLVLKVFKKGHSLSQLQRQWPDAVLRDEVLNFCHAGVMLEDGRFAFVMWRAWGDLRKLIDLAMEKNNMRGPPFPFESHGLTFDARFLMYWIACSMQSMHEKGVLHRDLKASNILLFDDEDPWLADFECSIGVEGTGFWRAPEVLLALKNKVRPIKAITFTEKMDVYGFAMTCYEIVSGRLPFEGELRPVPSSYDLVMGQGGVRPRLPSDLDSGVRDMIVRCWDWDPNVRPTIAEIIDMSIFDNIWEMKVYG